MSSHSLILDTISIIVFSPSPIMPKSKQSFSITFDGTAVTWAPPIIIGHLMVFFKRFAKLTAELIPAVVEVIPIKSGLNVLAFSIIKFSS